MAYDDLNKFDVPALIIHGDDDQIVPIENSEKLQAKLIKNAKLKVYKGAPHGLCTTEKDKVNPDLLALPKIKPIDVVRQLFSAIETGRDEVLADEMTRQVKAGLSNEQRRN